MQCHNMAVGLVFTAALILVGCALASPTGNEGLHIEEGPTCPWIDNHHDVNELELQGQMVDELMRCLKCTHTNERLNKNANFEEIRVYFKSYCDDLPVHKHCLVNMTSSMDLCLSASNRLVIDIQREVLDTVFDHGCTNFGETFAQVLSGIYRYLPDDVVGDCVSEEIRKEETSTSNAGTRMMAMFNHFDSIKTCVMNKFTKNHEAWVSSLESLLNDIERKIQAVRLRETPVSL